MYRELLSMSWEQMLNSEYLFKSNATKKIVQINGSELNSSDDSVIVIYYNVYTGIPMILTQRYNHKVDGINPPLVDGYSMYHKEEEEDGEVFTEVTYVLCSLQKALEE